MKLGLDIVRQAHDSSFTLGYTCDVSKGGPYCCTWLTKQPRLSPPVSATLADGCSAQNYMHVDNYNDYPRRHINVTKDHTGVVPDCHGVTWSHGSTWSTARQTVCCHAPHAQRAWSHYTSTHNAKYAGTVWVILCELCDSSCMGWIKTEHHQEPLQL